MFNDLSLRAGGDGEIKNNYDLFPAKSSEVIPGEILGGMNVSRHFTKKDAVLFESNRLKVQSDEN